MIIRELKIIKEKNLELTVIFFLLTSINFSLSSVMLRVKTVPDAESGERKASDIRRNRFKISSFNRYYFKNTNYFIQTKPRQIPGLVAILRKGREKFGAPIER